MTPGGRGRVDGVALSRRVAPFAVILALLTWAAAFLAGGNRPEPDLGPFVRRAFPGAKLEAVAPGVFEASRDGELLGHAAAGAADGYSGPITVAVGTDAGGQVLALALLEHRDTPVIVRSGLPLLRSLLGKAPGEPFQVGEDVDAVSGATQTSRGLAHASRAGAHVIAGLISEHSPEARGDVLFGGPEAVVLALLLMGAVGKNHPAVPRPARRVLRMTTLVVGLGALGFAFAQPWVVAFPLRLLTGDWPSWRTHLYWYVLLAGTLLAFSRAGKSPYCPWVCPFGAAQDALGSLGGAHRRHLPRPLFFAWVKAALLWLAVLLGLVYRNPAGASYEVFGAFFRLSGSGPQYAVLGVVVVTAVFFARPFCHWVCPVDAVERVLRPVRRRLIRGRGLAPPARRPLRVVRTASRPVVPVFRRLRDGLLLVAGLVCATLVVVHLSRAVPVAPGGESGLVGATFVSVDDPR